MTAAFTPQQNVYSLSLHKLSSPIVGVTVETNLFVTFTSSAYSLLSLALFCLLSQVLMAEILDLAATWTCGGAHVSSHRSTPMWQQRERILPALKSKVDESISVGVQEASGFKLDWFDWLWESPQPQCLGTPAVTNLLQTRHPVSHGWWPPWQAYLEWLEKQLSCPEAS